MLLRQLGAGLRTGYIPHRLSSASVGTIPIPSRYTRQFHLLQQLHRPSSPINATVFISHRAASTTAKSSPTTKRLRNFILTVTIITALTGGYILGTDTRSSIHTYVVPPLIRLLFPGPSGAEAAHAFGINALSRLYALHIPLRDRAYGIPQRQIPLRDDGTIDWDSLNEGGFANPFGLAIHLFGHPLTTPLGIPAGLDKHAEAIDALFASNPALGILEIGCITPKPQAGNPGVRVWRLAGSEGMLNRYGFNSVGSVEVARRLRERVRRFALQHHLSAEDVLDGLLPTDNNLSSNTLQRPLPASLIPGRLLAIQIGKNATTPADNLPSVVNDYITCVHTLGPYADLLVVNVSSPNTPGLRTLQSRAPLTSILTAVVNAADKVPRRVKPKVLVKVSPDEDTMEQIRDICAAVKDSGVAGVIVANTTTRRNESILVGNGVGISEEEKRVIKEEAGGVSGPVLYPRMINLVGKYRRELDSLGLWERFDGVENGGDENDHDAKGVGKLQRKMEKYWESSHRGEGTGVVVIGCGGVKDGEQAVEAMRKGAGGVWLYTAMVYGGVGTLGRVSADMRRIIRGGGKVVE